MSLMNDKMSRKSDSPFGYLGDEELRFVSRAASRLQACQAELDRIGHSAVSKLLADVELLNSDKIYPADTVEDAQSASQCYFHAHSDRTGEYGHFHTYLMPAGLPQNMRSIKPATQGDHANPHKTHCHLVGISVDDHGDAIGLFTINHWSSQEAVYNPRDLQRALVRFEITHDEPCSLVNAWVTNVLHCFLPQIRMLFDEREMRLAQMDQQAPKVPANEDETLEVPSEIGISIPHQLDEIWREMEWRGFAT